MQELGPLAGLSNIQQLFLSDCSDLRELGPLAGLSNLQTLDLRKCEQLQELGPLAGLSKLQSLDLMECVQVRELAPLAGLSELRYLDLTGCVQVRELGPLAALSSLRTLGLGGCREVQELGPLARLPALEWLWLEDCKCDLDITPLVHVTSLRELHIFHGPSLSLQQLGAYAGTSVWPQLRRLTADKVLEVPTELCSVSSGENCLPRIQAWFADLACGIAEKAEIKLLVLGNGNVGKTQICRRLRGEHFDPAVPTTHGIQLGEHTIDIPKSVDPNSGLTMLRFWDFGGQDIYLGTHALFLDRRAIYVIAWCPGAENSNETVHNGIVMVNRPLSYWIEYVRSLTGPEATVLVVQTQCDREADVRSRAPLPEPHGFDWLRETACSANSVARPDGMERLSAELKAAARRQTELHGRWPMPASWAAMGQTLVALRDGHDGHPRPTISVEEFSELAASLHGVLAPSVLLEYLHRGGQVFWNQQAFGGQVVLQLEWALQGIYAVLDRDRLLPILRAQQGLFTPELLHATVWQDKGERERDLLLSMMEQCRIAFKADNARYIAPAALPTEKDVAQRIEHEWRSATPDARAILHYDFLHEGVLRAMLCELGLRAGHSAVYWRYGICFYDTEAKSTIRIRSQQPDIQGQGGWIEVAAAGGDAGALVAKLNEALKGIRIGREPWIDWQERAPLADRRGDLTPEVPSDGPEVPGEESDSFAVVRPGPRPRLPGELRPVYVSYSWGGDSECIVDEMEDQLRAEGIELVRDKRRVRPGEWLSQFAAEIGRGDVVLVVLSKRYLQRYYCMQELLHLFHRSQGDKAAFLTRVVAIVPPDLALDSELDRLEYVDYWMKKDSEFSSKVAAVGAERLSPAGRDEWLAIKDFSNRTAELLSWVADTLMPRGFEGSGPATDMLKRRVGRPQ